MRILILFVMLSLSGCGIENNTNSTEVSISLGQSHVASGAIGAVGNIPANIQSVSVEALNPAGKVIAGPIIANRPNFTIRIRVPNGNGIRFRILAYAQASATGIVLYETLSAPVDLKGKPVAVPVKMNLSVKIAADKTSTFRGGLVNLIGKVSGNTPNAASPLLWAETGGTLTNTDPYGATNTWTAPATLGSYTIAARINPAINPDQDPTVKGTIQVNVVNQDPYVQSFNTTPITAVAGTQTTVSLLIADDLDGDNLQVGSPDKPIWVSLITTGSNPLTVQLQLSPPANTSGSFAFKVGITDGFGGNITQNITVTVIAAPTVTPTPVITKTFPQPIGDTTPLIFGNAVLGSVVDIYSDGQFVAQTSTFDVSDGGPPQGGFTYTFTTPLTEATHIFTAYATLNGIRSSASNSVLVTIDATAPTVLLTAPAGTQNTLFTVTATFSEPVTGVVAADFIISGGTPANFNIVNQTIYIFNVTPDANSTIPVTVDLPAASAIDIAGNPNTAAAQLSVNVDTLAPTVILSAPAGTQSGLFQVTATFSEPVTGVIPPDFTVVGGTPSNLAGTGATYTFDVTPAANSTTPVTVDLPAASAIDVAGNPNTAAIQLSVNVDTKAPTITIDALPAVTNADPYTITGTINDPTATVSVSIDALAPQTASVASSTWSFTTSLLGNGVHSISVAAIDIYGNATASPAISSLAIDTVAPSAPVITAPASAATLNNATLIISGTAEIASTIEIFDGVTLIGTAFTNGAGIFSFAPSPLTEGAHNFTATATDAAGNVSPASAAVAITVDTSAPTVSIDVLPVFSDIDPYTISGVAADAGSGIASLEIYISKDGVAQPLQTQTVSPWIATLSGPGLYDIYAVATDAVGNTTSTGSSQIYINNAIPAGTTHVWSGALNSNWHTPANWFGITQPFTTSSVFIPESRISQPSVSTQITIGNLRLEPLSILTLNTHLTVTNGFDNLGTINYNAFSSPKDLTITTGKLVNFGTINLGTLSGIVAPVDNYAQITVLGNNASISGNINNIASIDIYSNFSINGVLTTTAQTLTSNGSTLSLAGGFIQNTTFDNLLVAFTAPQTVFDNVTFQNYATTATPLQINYSGATQTFNNLNYNTPLTTGFHIGGTGSSNTITVASTNIIGTTAPSLTNAGTNIIWPATVISIANGNNSPCNISWVQGNSPYIVQDPVNINAGCRLQIDAGVVIKLAPATAVHVNNNGTLDVYGSPGAPVVFTSINDDAYGAIAAGSTGTPNIADWDKINFASGSNGSMFDTLIRYASLGIEMNNSSPALNNIQIEEFGATALNMLSTSGEITSPIITNINLITSSTSSSPLNMISTGTGIVAPSINTGLVISASTNITTGQVYLNGSGVNPTIFNVNFQGGVYSVYAINGAQGTLFACTLSGATNTAIYLSGNVQPSIDSSNIISNTPAPYQLDGQLLPPSVTTTVDATVTDPYSLLISGTLPANVTSYIMSTDPLLTGNSGYLITSDLFVDPGARLEIQAGSVIKFNAATELLISGVLDVYGAPDTPVIFTSINDDVYGAISPTSTGAPININDYWLGISYILGSSGSMIDARVRFVETGVYAFGSSPTLTNLSIDNIYLIGLDLFATLGVTTNPIINNINISEMPTSGTNGIEMAANVGGIISPIINGGSITAGSNFATPVALTTAGVNPTISNLLIQGGDYGIFVDTGASGTFSNNIFRTASSFGAGIRLFDAGNINITNNRIVNNATGIRIEKAVNATIQHNLIRGNTSVGIVVGNLNINPGIVIRNNLIIENPTGVQLLDDVGTQTGANAVLQSNTIADNSVTGLTIDLYATATLQDNIIANNAINFAVASAALTGDYNLTNDVIFPTAGPNIAGQSPLLSSSWYLDTVAAPSPAINASLNRNAVGVGYLTLNPYAQPALPDINQLDIGYHHAASDVTPSLNSVGSTIATDTLLPGLNGNVIITITPNILRSGLQISATITNNATEVGSVSLAKDLGDGTYEVVFTASGLAGGNDTVSISANGVLLGSTQPITW